MLLFVVGWITGFLAGLVIASLCVTARVKDEISYPKIAQLQRDILEKAAS